MNLIEGYIGSECRALTHSRRNVYEEMGVINKQKKAMVQLWESFVGHQKTVKKGLGRVMHGQEECMRPIIVLRLGTVLYNELVQWLHYNPHLRNRNIPLHILKTFKHFHRN